MNRMLELTDVAKSFTLHLRGGVQLPVVEGVNLAVSAGECVALGGASGAGKSSFLNAGLIPARPEGTRVLTAKPGPKPFSALAQALAEELSDEPNVVGEFLRFEEPEVALSLFERWRERHQGALLIVDQFEELFTQNPAQVQTSFAELLGRLPLDADTHVLLSMRDDFLFRCQEQSSLRPAFSDLTPLGTLSGSALRRALDNAPAVVDVVTSQRVISSDARKGLGFVPDYQALTAWDEAERERRT